MITENTGVLIAPPNPTDFVAGAVSGIEYKEVCQDWTPYLPEKERQFSKNADTYGCVSFSALNSLETQMNFLIRNNLLDDTTLQWLIDNGYIVELM